MKLELGFLIDFVNLSYLIPKLMKQIPVRWLKPVLFATLLYLGFGMELLHAQTSIEFGTDSYIQINDHPDLRLQEFTFSCWIMKYDGGLAVSTGVEGEEIYPVLSRGWHDETGSNCINYRFGLRKSDQVLFLELENRPEPTEDYVSSYVYGFTSLQENHWYHVAATCDSRNLTLYLNGVPEASMEVFLPPDASYSAPLSLGSSLNSTMNPEGAFHGRLDALRIYNYAIAKEQVAAIMNSEDMSLFPDLILGINMNDGSGNQPLLSGSIPQDQITGYNLGWSEGSHFNALVPPTSSADELLRLGLISDPQYCDCEAPEWAQRQYRLSLEKLPAAIDILNEEHVDLSLTLGDIIDTFWVSYDSILPLYEAFDSAHYFVLGNHDLAIEEAQKEFLLERFEMPSYYYDIERDGWRFLILDGTELARYARILHPELAEEGDSLIASVQGIIYDKPWNGGISRDQQAWIREKIEDAETREQHVLLFCHYPLLPDSIHLNLWNREAILDIMSEYEHVVAFINGHNHAGGYDFRSMQHFVTQFSMVDTKDSNSFSMLSLLPSYLKFKGYGYNPDRILRYRDAFREGPIPEIDNYTLHYYHDSADFISLARTPAYATEDVNYALLGGGSDPGREWFEIRNDSLFLSGNPDYLLQEEFPMQLGAITYLYDTASSFITLHLDTTVALQKLILKDTILAVDSAYAISIDSLYTDYSREGLEISCQGTNSETLSITMDDGHITCMPLKYGNAAVKIEALDPYTGFRLRDSFLVQVVDPANHPPEALEQELQIAPFADTIYLRLDTLFHDPDADILSYEVQDPGNPDLHMKHEDSQLHVWADKGLLESVELIADDARGGRDSLVLEIKFNTSPHKFSETDSLTIALAEPVREIMLDTLYGDLDEDDLLYSIESNSMEFSYLLRLNTLSIYPEAVGEGELSLQISDLFGGILFDTLKVVITQESNLAAPHGIDEKWRVYPNPARDVLRIEHATLGPDRYFFRIYDELGESVQMLTKELAPGESILMEVPLNQLHAGIYYLRVSSSEGKVFTCSFIRQADD